MVDIWTSVVSVLKYDNCDMEKYISNHIIKLSMFNPMVTADKIYQQYFIIWKQENNY